MLNNLLSNCEASVISMTLNVLISVHLKQNVITLCRCWLFEKRLLWHNLQRIIGVRVVTIAILGSAQSWDRFSSLLIKWLIIKTTNVETIKSASTVPLQIKIVVELESDVLSLFGLDLPATVENVIVTTVWDRSRGIGEGCTITTWIIFIDTLLDWVANGTIVQS